MAETLVCLVAVGVAACGVAAVVWAHEGARRNRRFEPFLDASLLDWQLRHHHLLPPAADVDDEDLLALPSGVRERRLWAFRRYVLAHEPPPPPVPSPRRDRQRHHARRAGNLDPHEPLSAGTGMLRRGTGRAAREDTVQQPQQCRFCRVLGRHLTVFHKSYHHCQEEQQPHPQQHQGPRLSRLMLAVFASRKATLEHLLRTGQGDVGQRDARDRTALWWACRWGETHMVRLLLRFGADELAADHQGAMPRAAAKMGPSARTCLGLLKEAERANLLWKVRVLHEKQAATAAMVAAVVVGDDAEESKKEEEGHDDDDDSSPHPQELFVDRARLNLAWPKATLRPVPSPRACWWVRGGKGSTKKAKGGVAAVPWDVRAAIVEHVVGPGLADDLFRELRHYLI